MRESTFNTPIAFFVFNRLDTTKKVFETIKAIKPTKLYLISDAAREDKVGEKEKVAEVRQYIEKYIDWDCEVYKNYAKSNMGCRDRMASGISWFFDNEEMGILLEDDCLPAISFFTFCQELLIKYKEDTRIGMIGGYKLVSSFEIDGDYCFSNFPAIWGWASWRRAWSCYDIKMKLWPEIKKSGKLRHIYMKEVYKQKESQNDTIYYENFDTWDYQWVFAMAINRMMAIVPKYNLIQNIGFGPEATHTITREQQTMGEIKEIIFPIKHPEYVCRNYEYDLKFEKTQHERNHFIKSLIPKCIKIFLKRILRRL